jgi:hypothetical protein
MSGNAAQDQDREKHEKFRAGRRWHSAISKEAGKAQKWLAYKLLVRPPDGNSGIKRQMRA